jgi:hypothetical protein
MKEQKIKNKKESETSLGFSENSRKKYKRNRFEPYEQDPP